ncbi:MAG: carboxypeptidase regulatory-like domain-containing protein, partial [Vicinamibacterales bacterium]
MIRYRSFLRTALLAGVVLAAPKMVLAQAAITGAVTDESGGALPGVTVEAASPALIEKVRTVFTDSEGLYRLVDLRPGQYKVTFTLPGFSTLVRDQITLEGTGTVTLNGQLKVGSLEETLTVSGEAPIVDVSSTAKEQVMTRELLNALPTGRQMWTVAVTMPGVTLSGQDVGGAGGLQQTRMRAFGTVEQEVTIEVDGILMNSVHGGGSTQQYFNDGMTQEMSVQTGALGAETQTGGVRLNMIPESGGNQFHGSLVAIAVPNSSFQSSNLDD